MRSWRSLALVASVLGALGGAQGCADDGVSLHVICPIFPTVQDSVCTFDPAGEGCVAEGVMNIAVTDHYSMELRVESGLKAHTSDVPVRGETNGLQIRSAEVEIRYTSGDRIGFIPPDAHPEWGSLPNPFTVPASGYLAPLGRDAVALTVIDQDYGKWLKQTKDDGMGNIAPLEPEIMVSIKMKGVTNGNVAVEGGEYIWPIRLTYEKAESCVKVDYCAGMLGQDFSANACP